MLKRYEVIGVYDDGTRTMSLRRPRYRSYAEALARLDRERCVGAPGAYGLVVLPTRTVVHAPASAPAPARDFFAGETCRCPACGADGPTHPASAVWAPAGEPRRRRCLACGSLVVLPTQASASALLVEEPPAVEPEPEPEPALTLVPDLAPVVADAWPRAATA